MSARRSKSGPLDALLVLDRDARMPLRDRVVVAVRVAIREGRLEAGARLPSSRALAADLGCSRGVVSAAYQQLVAEGLAQATVGSGTRVSATAEAGTRVRPVGARPSSPRFDLRPGFPDLSAFPRRIWATAVSEALRASSASTLRSADARGSDELRHVLAGYLARVRGVRVDPEGLLLCCGVTHAASLVCRVLASEGATAVCIEDPGWPRLAEVVRTAGLSVCRAAVDDEGIRTVEIPEAAAAVITSPAHQFPTGVALGEGRRGELIRWARSSSRRLIIEDDYDAEFRYDRTPMPALQREDRDRVAFLGSVSKTLIPSLYLGWMVAPRSLVEGAADLMQSTGAVPSIVEQLALARLIDTGGYDRHLSRTRHVYRRRRDILVAALQQYVPEARISGVAAGLHLVVRFPDHVDEADLVSRAEARGLRLTALSRYYQQRSPGPGVVLSYANAGEGSIPAAVQLLADIVSRTHCI